MEYKLIQGNSVNYFNNIKGLNINLVITSPSYYTDTPKRNSKTNEIGIGETKDLYIKQIRDAFEGIVKNLEKNAKVVIVLGRYGDLPIRSLVYSLEDSFKELGLKMNSFKEFGHRHSEAIIIFSNNDDEIIYIPEFERLQVYKKVGFFGEIDKEVLDWAITNFSKENQLVVDPFAGAGSTLKRAYMNKRSAIGVELDSEYVKAGQL